MLLKKTLLLPVIATLTFAGTSAIAGEQEKKVKVVEMKTDVELVSADGEHAPIKLVFDGKPSEEEIEKAIADLSPEKQEKIRKIVKNLNVEHSDDGVKVFAFKTGDSDVEKHIEIHSDAEFSTSEGNNVFVMSDGTKHAQVFKFKFEGEEGDGAFKAIKHLLESSELTPNQIVELQNILSQK
ncbi:hypothetical protein [Pseudoalteromonas sp. G4]|uniref:hypothetical protein n=1 Tax=Pseudoalteromonas sp. G4 TaxID=2992761 RepID=UPI00237EC063|nr:hypothetical protein [Pseudoalteromonas sp. G4]MDE3272390.1 hypothetical protein [Pseudoalteromonas sp. G4]